LAFPPANTNRTLALLNEASCPHGTFSGDKTPPTRRI
jgi:hypothetical protein